MKVQTMARWLGRIVVPTTAAIAVMLIGSQTTAGQQQGTVFRATTDYVSSDVTVHDKDGKFVPDLTVDDFRVFEDGVLQKLTVFTPIIGGRAMGSVTTIAAPVATEGLILPKSRPPSDSSGRIFMIFIDDMHLQPLDTPQVKKVLGQIRDELVHDNDMVAFVSTGYSSIATGIVYDQGHRRFNEAIAKTMGGGMTPTELIDAQQSAEGPVGLRYQAHVAFSTAYDLLAQAEKITNRRKSFIYVSNGYSFNPFKDARYKKQQELYGGSSNQSSDGSNSSGDGSGTGDANNSNSNSTDENPFEKQGAQFAEADLISEIAELVRAARRANVTFYTIDPRGLNAGPDIMYQDKLSFAEWRDFMTTTTSSLMVLGDETGGFCICNNNDFKKGLQRIDNETSDYYMLGYISSNPDPLKRRRTIKIETTRAGIELVYKPEYTIPRPNRKSPAKPGK
jgi:VWFA-related protein